MKTVCFCQIIRTWSKTFFWTTVIRIVQLMTDRSRYVNPSKNYWFSFSAFLTDILKYMLLVDINDINVSVQRFFFTLSCADTPGRCRLLQINCHYIFLLICYFCILMYNIQTRIFTYFWKVKGNIFVTLCLSDEEVEWMIESAILRVVTNSWNFLSSSAFASASLIIFSTVRWTQRWSIRRWKNGNWGSNYWAWRSYESRWQRSHWY